MKKSLFFTTIIKRMMNRRPPPTSVRSSIGEGNSYRKDGMADDDLSAGD
jgi:hypothetical protein